MPFSRFSPYLCPSTLPFSPPPHLNIRPLLVLTSPPPPPPPPPPHHYTSPSPPSLLPSTSCLLATLAPLLSCTFQHPPPPPPHIHFPVFWPPGHLSADSTPPPPPPPPPNPHNSVIVQAQISNQTKPGLFHHSNVNSLIYPSIKSHLTENKHQTASTDTVSVCKGHHLTTDTSSWESELQWHSMTRQTLAILSTCPGGGLNHLECASYTSHCISNVY